MNRINRLFNSNKKDLLSIYFCAGAPTLDGTAAVIRALEKHGVSKTAIRTIAGHPPRCENPADIDGILKSGYAIRI